MSDVEAVGTTSSAAFRAGTTKPRSERTAGLIVALALIAGVLLRFLYPGAIEFKGDEAWTFNEAQRMLSGGEWPLTGMPMSVGGANPGLSVWVFAALGWISGATTPPELAGAVQILNVLALLAFTAFAVVAIPRGEREPWLWALALWAVNPLAVLFERKIWPPSVLPILTVALLAAWWHRRHWAGSLLIGVLGAVIGQIHPPSAFFAVALVVWAFLDDPRAIRWGPLIGGAAVASLPALPWAAALLARSPSFHPWSTPKVHFFTRWLTQPFGFGTDYAVGDDFSRFLAAPRILGFSTYGVGLIHAALAVLSLILLGRACLALWGRRSGVVAVVVGSTPTGVILRAACFGYGALLTLVTIIGADSNRHYLILVAPLMALWVAQLAALADGGPLRPNSRRLLAVLCLTEGLLAFLLLQFAHAEGTLRGDFGTSWEAQQSRTGPEGTRPP